MTTVNSSKGAYKFAAEPRIVQTKSKYRGDEARSNGNQSDPRTKNSLNINLGGAKSSKRSLNPDRHSHYSSKEEEVPEEYYAPLTDRSVQDEKKLIPDYYVDRPPTPEFKPLEPGVDVSTQIDNVELFDYLLEVKPILQVLVGKTLEQAQLELREEDEKKDEVRHKREFEKKRNAELMVTQRKEALHLRKQDEKARRNKQYEIEKEDKRITHQKYISKLLSKYVTANIPATSVAILSGPAALGISMNSELKKLYLPEILKNTGKRTVKNLSIQQNIEAITAEIQSGYSINHAAAVKKEFDRKKKIYDDAEALRIKTEQETKRRRERRRKLRFHNAKDDFLGKIQATIVAQSVEVENAFAANISDIFPAEKESVATIGGLLGELWLILETLTHEETYQIQFDQVVKILTSVLLDKYKTREFKIYLHSQYNHIIEETLAKMSEDLISFNQNKAQIIEELAQQMQEANHFQSLGILNSQKLLEPAILKQLNQALFFIYFTSLDYKLPEKKEEVVDENDPNKQEQPAESPEKDQEQEQPAEEENQSPKPEGDEEQQGEKVEEAAAQENAPVAEVVIEEPKLPEITEFEQKLNEAKNLLKLQFVNDWSFRKNADAIVRFRIPLNRKVQEVPVEGEEKKEEGAEEEVKSEASQEAQKEKEKKKVEVPPPQAEEVVVPEETFEEKMIRLIGNDDFIEPYDGSTFEKEKIEFTEQVISRETPLKIYNPNLVEGKYIVQINERGQDELRKELITLIKENVPEWQSAYNENILAKAYVKYKKTEKILMDQVISDIEQIPIFDIENV